MIHVSGDCRSSGAHSFLCLLTLAKKASGVLSFFRGTGGKSPDLSSQKKETLRGADSAYYQVGQMGKEGPENQGAETQGTLSHLLHLSFRTVTSPMIYSI